MNVGYDEFALRPITFLNALPRSSYADALPHGYFTGFRGWDIYQTFVWGDFKATDTVLDCGSWQTFLALFLAQFVHTVDATDNYKWATRDFVKEQHLQGPAEWETTITRLGHGKVKAFSLDLQAIDKPNNTYDKITCISTIEHVVNDTQAMRELMRVLKPGGRLLLTTEFDEARGKPYSEADGSWYRVYDRQTWEALIAPYPVLHQEISPMPHEHYFTVAFCVIEKPL